MIKSLNLEATDSWSDILPCLLRYTLRGGRGWSKRRKNISHAWRNVEVLLLVVLHYISMKLAWKAKLKVKIPQLTPVLIRHELSEINPAGWNMVLITPRLCHVGSIPVLAGHLTVGLVVPSTQNVLWFWEFTVWPPFELHLYDEPSEFPSLTQAVVVQAAGPGPLSSRFWRKVDVGSLLCCLEGL